MTFNMKNNKFLNGGRGLAGRRVLFFFFITWLDFFLCMFIILVIF
jgi:hypothetical protein